MGHRFESTARRSGDAVPWWLDVRQARRHGEDGPGVWPVDQSRGMWRLEVLVLQQSFHWQDGAGGLAAMRAISSLQFRKKEAGVTVSSYDFFAPHLTVSHLKTSLDEARKYLTDVATSEMFHGIPTEIYLPFGSVTSQMLSVAVSCQADSIVLTSQGYTGATRWVLGSVAEYVVRHASLPVLLLQEGNASEGDLHPGHERPVRALVPLDGSYLAKAALEPAALLISALAAPAGGTLHLTRVVRPGKTAPEEEQKNPRHKAERYLGVRADQVREELLARSEALDLSITWSVAFHQDAAEGIITHEVTSGTSQLYHNNYQQHHKVVTRTWHASSA